VREKRLLWQIARETQVSTTSTWYKRTFFKNEFGAHNNTMKGHTVGALAIRSNGNVQGRYPFYKLNTDKIIN